MGYTGASKCLHTCVLITRCVLCERIPQMSKPGGGGMSNENN